MISQYFAQSVRAILRLMLRLPWRRCFDHIAVFRISITTSAWWDLNPRPPGPVRHSNLLRDSNFCSLPCSHELRDSATLGSLVPDIEIK